MRKAIDPDIMPGIYEVNVRSVTTTDHIMKVAALSEEHACNIARALYDGGEVPSDTTKVTYEYTAVIVKDPGGVK